MTIVKSHLPGSPSWVELSTTDGEGAKKFYTSLFGWDYTDNPVGPDMVYTMYNKGGKSVAASFQKSPSMGMNDQPACWQLYFTVDNLEAAIERVKGSNGKVLMGPHDVFDAGRMVVAQDPQNAVFMLWEPKKHIGAEVVEEPGALSWTELATTDLEAAVEFYKAVLPYEAEKDPNSAPGMDYILLKIDGSDKAGVRGMVPQESGMPPYWSIYFAVDDINASTAKVQELGGKVVVPLTKIAPGSFTGVMDPQGVYFLLFQPQ